MDTTTLTASRSPLPLHGGQSTPAHFPQRVLACLSLSDRAPAIAAEAWRIAQASGAECQFLHVGSADTEAQHHLRNVLTQARVPQHVPLWLHPGRPRQVIEQVVRRHGIDLVVAGVLNHRASFSRYFRSIAGQIAAAAPCSVLLLTDPQLEPRPLDRIVASVDFDELSRSMLGNVLNWGKREGTRHWHIVHEYDPNGFYAPHDGQNDDSRVSRSRRLNLFLSAFNWPDGHVQRLCLLNKHGCDALWYAQTMKADMLCLPLSMRRQGFWERMLRFRLDVDIHALPCAVLLYRDASDRLINERAVPHESLSA